MTKTDASRVHFLYAIRWVGVLLSVFWLAFVSFSAHRVSAATSQTINFQARLMQSSGAIVPDGAYNVEFKLYNTLTSSGSGSGTCVGDASCLWFERYTGSNKVSVANGYLTVELGTQTSLPSIDWSQNLYLTMNIGGTGSSPVWDGEMSPRLHLTAVPHAFTADQLSKTNGSLTSTLSFIQPATVSRNIFVPDEGGTLCIQNSANCGFALSSGSGSYIQNGTSLQSSANFNISGSGTAGSFLTSLVDTASAGGTLSLGTTNAASIALNKATSVTGNLSQSGGTISLAATGTATLSATGALSLSGSTASLSAASGNNVTISTSGAGQVQIASGTGGIALKANGGNTVLNVDTSTNRVSAGVNSFGTTSATSTGQLYVSGANNAAIAGSVSTGNTTYRVVTQGRYAYVQLFNALKVVDVAVPTSPVIVGSATTTNGVSALAAGAGYVYSLSNGGNTLQAIDVTNPTSPTVTTTVSVTSPYAAVVSGRYLYVGTQDTTANFRVYDLANPGVPRLVTTLTASGGTVPYAIAIQGKYAYLASSTLLQSINISNPAAPVSAGTLAVNSAISLAIQGKYAYLVNNGSAKLQVVNISNPASMTSVSNTIAVPTDAQEISVQDRIAYVTSGTGTSLRWFDISNPASPVILGTYNVGSALRGLSVQGRYAYIADNGASALDVIDLGGAYLQQAEVGGLQATNLSVDSNAILGGDVLVGGSLQVAQSLQVNGNFSASGISSVFQSTTNSATALQVQNASGTTVFDVDTTNGRVGIGNAAPAYTLDVTGDVNTSTQYRIANTVICTSSGCTPAAGSGNYIQNGTTVQSANMYVQAATSGSVAATIRANAAGTGDILDLKNGAGTNVMTVGSAGSTLIKTSTDATSAFMVQSNGGTSALNVDTTNARVGIGGITTPAVSLDVEGAIQQTGLSTSNTAGTDSNKWTLLGTCSITAQYRQCVSTISILGGNDGATNHNTQATVSARVKQQDPLGSAPYINVTLNDTAEVITKSDIVAVTTQNDATATVVQLYGRITNTFEQWNFTPLMNPDQSPSKWAWSQSAGFLAALPAGTQTTTVYGDTNANTLNIQTSANGTAFQIQNATGTVLYSVNTATGLVTQTGALKLNVTAANATTFTTPLGSAVQTAINIPLYDPGAFGQILAFGLPSTAATTARAISVFDARSSGTIQPAIALFSPNENDVFGLSWNGLNTTASLETASAAIALRPGGTNVKLWAGSTGVAIGSNVSSAAYPLDVTGDVNTSTALRIGGTSVCDTTGGTGCIAKSGSGYYIHNDTALQTSSNFNISGTGIAATAFQAPLIDVSSATTLSIGTTNATAVSIANNNAAHTVNIANGGTSTAQTVSVGSTFGSSATTIQGGTGTSAVLLTAGSGGNIKLTSVGTGSINLTPGSSGVFIRPTADSTAALQVISNTSGNSVFRVDTTNERVGVGVITDPISAKFSIATSSTVSLRAYQGGASDAFQLGNATDDFLTVGSTGNFLLKPTSNSSSAFRIQNSGGAATLFTVDTSGNNIQIGSSTTDSTSILLTLDSSNVTSDPSGSGTGGAMYYSTAYNAMRCYQDSVWSNCSDPTRLSHGYNIQEEFIASSSSGANYTCGGGSMGATYAWACNTSGSPATVGPVAADAYSRPGQMQLGTGTSTTGVASMYLGGGTTPAFFIGGGETYETAINIPTLSTASQDYLIRVGLCDNNAHAGACTNGVYFEYNRSSSTSWVGKVIKSGGTSAATATTKAVATGWTNLRFVATSANSVTFYVKGPGETTWTSLGAIGSSTSLPNASANATTIMNIIDRTAGAGTASSTFKVDYIDYWNDLQGNR